MRGARCCLLLAACCLLRAAYCCVLRAAACCVANALGRHAGHPSGRDRCSSSNSNSNGSGCNGRGRGTGRAGAGPGKLRGHPAAPLRRQRAESLGHGAAGAELRAALLLGLERARRVHQAALHRPPHGPVPLRAGARLRRRAVADAPQLRSRRCSAQVWTVVGANVVRCVVTYALPQPSSVGDIFWLLARFASLLLELSIIVLAYLCGTRSNSRQGVRLAVAPALGLAIAYVTIQGAVEFTTAWPSSGADTDVDWGFYTTNGLLFLLVASALFALLYLTVAILPHTALQRRWPMPSTRLTGPPRPALADHSRVQTPAPSMRTAPCYA